MDKSRFEASNPAQIAYSKWWDKVMGVPSTTIPAHTIQGIQGLPAEHVMYSYFFRPKYEIRKIIHKRVWDFAIDEDCAVMHVRRGDSIMHAGAATVAKLTLLVETFRTSEGVC